MRVEDAPFLGSHPFAHLSLHLENLVPGLDQRPFQPIDLFPQPRLRNFTPGDARPALAQHNDLAAAYAGGHRYAPEDLFSCVRRFWHG